MKIVVIMDSDGHFQAAELSDKFEVFKMITTELSDEWETEKDEVELNEVNYNSSTDEEFEEFVNHFVSRGKLEIISL